jgi:hypothetical protein
MSSNSDGSSDEEDVVARRQRIFRPRIVVGNAAEFKERFRLSMRQFEMLLNAVGPRLESATLRSKPISPKESLLMALRFYASNGFYYSMVTVKVSLFFRQGICYIKGPSKASVCRAIRRVTMAINVVV